jgi:hypothetical protein
MVNLFVLILLALATSCSSLKSGHYVQVKESDTIDSLAKEFNIPKEKITEFNHGKTVKPGEWVFIPLNRGVLAQDSTTQAFDPNMYLKSGEYLWPVPSSSTISSGFGSRWGKAHEGVDIPAIVGSHIVAAAAGVVVYSGSDIGGYGNITVLAHRNGFFTVYAHAKKNFTHKGQRVYRGQVIAQVGMTGRTYGPHLHFEMRKNGEAVDPSTYIASN